MKKYIAPLAEVLTLSSEAHMMINASNLVGGSELSNKRYEFEEEEWDE